MKSETRERVVSALQKLCYSPNLEAVCLGKLSAKKPRKQGLSQNPNGRSHHEQTIADALEEIEQSRQTMRLLGGELARLGRLVRKLAIQ